MENNWDLLGDSLLEQIIKSVDEEEFWRRRRAMGYLNDTYPMTRPVDRSFPNPRWRGRMPYGEMPNPGRPLKDPSLENFYQQFMKRKLYGTT